VTHRYTLLLGGRVLTGAAGPLVEAIAWAEDTVLATGTDAEVSAVSRGDSRTVDLRGAWVIPLSTAGEVAWPTDTALEVGGPADLAILLRDPRDSSTTAPALAGEVMAVVRGGRIVDGALP